MKIKAQAKANLALDVLSCTDDGYHLMDMVNAPVDLYDEMTIEPASKDLVTCANGTLPPVNTLTRTLEKLHEHGLKNHYHVELTKNIPEKAGLGGGSADAAALMQALIDLENLPLDQKTIDEIAFSIGADVPCCLRNDFTRVKGKGEQVEELHVHWKIPVILVQGSAGISTAQAFVRHDQNPGSPLDIDIVQDAVKKRDIGLLYQTMTNALEKQAFDGLEEMLEIKEDMLDAGLVRVMMTGSGSVLMGFCVDDDVMEEAREHLAGRYPFVWKGWIGR